MGKALVITILSLVAMHWVLEYKVMALEDRIAVLEKTHAKG